MSGTTTVTLQSELIAQKAAFEARVGARTAALVSSDIDALRATGIIERAARPGQPFPAAALLDAHGESFDLGSLASRKALIVTFYRGGWCPYCNLELRAYQALLPRIREAGAELVAISPEMPDRSLSTAQKNGLTFTVLSDAGGALATALGIRFELSESVLDFYRGNGLDLPSFNGDGRWSLPLPATFVLARGGVIAASFIEADYRKRAEPSAVIAALNADQPEGDGQ
jgi:peroxiredoxin